MMLYCLRYIYKYTLTLINVLFLLHITNLNVTVSGNQYVTWRNEETLGGIEGCITAVKAADPDFGT